MDERAFQTLKEFSEQIPAIKGTISTGSSDDGFWWVKFQIDINHSLAWHTVQELYSIPHR